jgi:hypothetical protein
VDLRGVVMAMLHMCVCVCVCRWGVCEWMAGDGACIVGHVRGFEAHAGGSELQPVVLSFSAVARGPNA